MTVKLGIIRKQFLKCGLGMPESLPNRGRPCMDRLVAWLDRFRMLSGVNKEPADDAEGKEKRDFAPADLLEAIRKRMNE